MADGTTPTSLSLVARLEARIESLEREVAALRAQRDASVTPHPKTAAERKRASRAAHPERDAAYNLARKARRHETCDAKRDAKRDASVTPPVGVTNTTRETPRNHEGSSVGVTVGVTPLLRDAIVTPPSGTSQVPSLLSHTLSSPSSSPPAPVATTGAREAAPILADGTPTSRALEIVSAASRGTDGIARLSFACSLKAQRQLGHLLVEHGCTLRDLEDLGRVVARPPPWCAWVKGRWTVLTLLGKASADGTREGAMITQLLAEAADRRDAARPRPTLPPPKPEAPRATPEELAAAKAKWFSTPEMQRALAAQERSRG